MADTISAEELRKRLYRAVQKVRHRNLLQGAHWKDCPVCKEDTDLIIIELTKDN